MKQQRNRIWENGGTGFVRWMTKGKEVLATSELRWLNELLVIVEHWR